MPPIRFFKNKPLATVYLFLLGSGMLLLGFSGPEKKSTAPSSYSTSQTVAAPDVTTDTACTTPDKSLFELNLPQQFLLPEANDWVAQRILKDNGAVFVAQGTVARPHYIIFANAADCENWQVGVKTRREKFGNITIELQTEAMEALMAARKEAAGKNLRITPRGTWAARRSYHDTEKIWNRRIVAGLAFWQRRGKLSAQEAAQLRSLAPAQQVKEILQLEAKGLYFSKNFNKSVLYSSAAPGASQHIAMLALDINEYNQAAVRAILARHGWFQTVISDLPHFTYLGTTQADLPKLGLKKTVKMDRIYWTPA